MTDNTLLAYLAPRLTNRTEDIAVRALWYILSKSEMAMNALEEALKTGGANVDRIVRLKIEATGDNQERPDLAALDDDGVEHILIEAKFGAGLTPNQPVEYLKRLPEDRPSALLFIAPERRREELWTNLRQRVSESNSISLGDDTKKGPIWSTSAGKNRHLLLTSWRYLLCSMKAKANEETSVMCDIQQLQGLCNQMDAEAFLPLRPDELSSEFPKRILDLNRLIYDSVERAKFVTAYRTSSWRYEPGGNSGPSGDIATGKYIGIGKCMGHGDRTGSVWFGINFKHWAGPRKTPLWLLLMYDSPRDVPPTLKELERTDPPELIYENAQAMWISIDLPTDVEYDEVLDAVVERLRCVAELIGSETN